MKSFLLFFLGLVPCRKEDVVILDLKGGLQADREALDGDGNGDGYGYGYAGGSHLRSFVWITTNY